MKTKVCVWIDSKNAFIVFWGGEVTQLESGVKHSFPYQRRATDHKETGESFFTKPKVNPMSHFYDQVVAQISAVESIYLFGPQKSKDELNYRLMLRRLETCDLQALVEAS